MFNKKTTIIIGAGASSEVNLPTGNELKKTIARMLDYKFDDFGQRERNGDDLVYQALVEIVARKRPSTQSAIKPLIDASWKIRDALPLAISIDNFIDAHQSDKEVERCGKLAIVKAILEAERDSLLYVNPRDPIKKLNFETLSKTWFGMFWKLLTENCTESQLEERILSIEMIVFNYDRCIEHFIYHSLQTYYKVDENKAASLVRSMKIYHPYGTVGGLPWHGGTHMVTFGGEVSSSQLVQLADEIKTFTEGTNPNSSDIVAIRNGLASSQIVIFLGFAYHRQNLQLLRPQDKTGASSEPVRYFGTAKGISNSDTHAISSELSSFMQFRSLLGTEIRNDLDCAQLFQEYWRSLSIS